MTSMSTSTQPALAVRQSGIRDKGPLVVRAAGVQRLQFRQRRRLGLQEKGLNCPSGSWNGCVAGGESELLAFRAMTWKPLLASEGRLKLRGRF